MDSKISRPRKKQTRVFNAGNTSPQNTQLGLNRHAVKIVDDLFYHYDRHDETIHKYPLQCLVGRQDERKYLIRLKKVYSVRPKFQDE